ncbi:MAG TPA: hypothetical protein ENG95_06475 [Nitrospirae bacterium]|nr:PAS fold protein [bacterium BMS3Abin10]GBE38250.1 PAS fold protein [bacterium BMS3Bbin08]HDH50538.1 hypothetical protein [Nitrospirota bacterium]HDO26269.1 hypothetical protein [Nitrospirota bacterium]
MNQRQLIKNPEIGIIEAITESVTIQDPDYKILYQNQASKNSIGDQTGKYCYNAYGRNNICEKCVLTALFKDGKTHKMERIVHTNADMECFEVTLMPLRDSAGKITAGIEILREINKYKWMEESLKVFRKNYHKLVDNSL